MLNRTAGEVVSDAIMLGTVKPTHSLLIVEGVDDLRFWTPRVGDTCTVIYASGKTVGKTAVQRLNALGFSRHVGVFDKDYDDIARSTSIAQNIIFWDAHSLETVLFLSEAGDKLLAEVFDAGDMQRIEQAVGKLKTAIVQVAEQIGRVRYLHHLMVAKVGRDVDAEAVTVYRFLPHGQGFVISEETLFLEAARCGAVPSVVQARVKMQSISAWDSRHLIRGHDISIICNAFALEVKASVSSTIAEKLLRASFERQHLEATTVYADLRRWENAHVPYRVLN